ncbi:MAG: LCP family protein [Actinomycetota bacterium]|nr:LCP family protein [Actinomycetota bacterium]
MSEPPDPELPPGLGPRPTMLRPASRLSVDIFPEASGGGTVLRRTLLFGVGGLFLVAVVMGAWLYKSWNDVPRFSDLSDEWSDVVPAVPSNDGAASRGPVLPLRPASLRGEPDVEAAGGPSSGLGFVEDPSQPPPTTEPIVLPEVEGREEVETFLVFSTGTTDISDEQARAIGVSDPELRGSDDLTDVLMLFTIGKSTGEVAVLSIPRDTWLDHRRSRINGVFRSYGPAALAADVAELTGLDVDHLVRVNMMGFVQLTDLLGGVDITVAQATRDVTTGLDLPAGTVHLDGATALRFVRTRHAEHLVGEDWIADGSADFGRMQRQRSFLVAMLDAAWSFDAVTNLGGVLDSVQRNVVLDEDLGLADLVDLARKIRQRAGGLPGFQMPAEVGWVGPASVVFVDRVAARELVSSVVGTVIM